MLDTAIIQTLPLTCVCCICKYVGFTYNEDNNVIMTVNGSASQMRGSEYFSRQAAVFWVETNGLSRNSACLKIYNEQKQSKLSEYSMGS